MTSGRNGPQLSVFLRLGFRRLDKFGRLALDLQAGVSYAGVPEEDFEAALVVGNIPDEDFNTAVESDDPSPYSLSIPRFDSLGRCGRARSAILLLGVPRGSPRA